MTFLLDRVSHGVECCHHTHTPLSAIAFESQDEDKIQSLAWKALNTPNEPRPVRRALEVVVAELHKCIKKYIVNQEMSAFVVAAPRASLRHTSGVKHLFSQYAAAHGLR